MKRLREVETRVVAQEMVTLANTIDRTEAMLLIFASVDPLLEILKHRPILVINLMLTNKPLLALFSERIPLIWRVLLDQLVANEQGEYAASVYPFFIYEHDAFAQRYQRLAEAFDWPEKTRAHILRGPANANGKEWSLWHNPFYWRVEAEDTSVTILYAQDVLSQYNELMSCFDYLEELLEPIIYFSSDNYPFEYDFRKKIEIEWLGDAVRVTHNPQSFSPGEILLHIFTQARRQVEDVAQDLEAFIYHDDPDHADIVLLHFPDPERYNHPYSPDTDRAFPRLAGVILDYLKRLSTSLLLRLRLLCDFRAEELAELYPPLVLTATSVMPYRQVVFQVLHPTPEDHRLLLLRILRELTSEAHDKAAMIRDYGRCFRCGSVVDQVSPVHLLPHCGDRLCKQLG